MESEVSAPKKRRRSSAVDAWIYALFDPRDPHAYRYLGKTSQPPSERLKEHLRNALARKADGSWRYHVTPARAWLRKLRRAGLRPGILVLEHVPRSEAKFAEQRWIATLREAGYFLVNATNGGEGPHLYEASLARRERQSVAARARMSQPDVRAYYSRLLTARLASPEARAELSRQATEQWSSPQARAEQSVRVKRGRSTPEAKQRASEGIKRSFAGPGGQARREAISARCSGEGNPQAKLDWTAVRRIRQRYAAGGISQQKLSNEFGVAQTLISQIVRRRIWQEGAT